MLTLHISCPFFIIFLIISVQDSDDDEDEDNALIMKSPFDEENNENHLERVNETLINDSNPIMVCSNAMNKTHNCVFCKCFKCHMQESQNKDNKEKIKGNEVDHQSKRTRHLSRRVQRAKNVSQGQVIPKRSDKKNSDRIEGSERKCNHIDDLSFFTDATFFSKSYKEKNKRINNSERSKVYLPTKCSVCHCEIVNIITRKKKTNMVVEV